MSLQFILCPDSMSSENPKVISHTAQRPRVECKTCIVKLEMLLGVVNMNICLAQHFWKS